MGQANAADAAFLRLDSHQSDALFLTLKGLPHTTGATLARSVRENFRELVRQSIATNLSLLLFFAAALSAAIVYNDARISLAERGRELATLRVMGFTRAEVARVLFGELALVMLAGLPLGCLLGWGLAAAVIPVFGNDMLRMPVLTSGFSFIVGVATVVAAGILSGLVVRRRVDTLDLVAVLKTRE